ncbi:hypothetical protein SD457_09415 [Coprobacillaceae bacterium CR2/5/TPMF4]|nr:hypothetical protein SD457_09415 [Coprobacillaceae bacterium CR2/5/TPMF4]
MTKSVLLEPYFAFSLEIPAESLSKAIYDIELMNGEFKIKDQTADKVILSGKAPVSKMQNYQNEVISYTKGKGRLIYRLDGYQPCQEQDKIIEQINYDSEADLNNPTGSVFCSHGAGFNVSWDEVPKYMHIPYQTKRLLSQW